MLRPGQTVAPRSLPPHEALIEAMLPDGYKAEPRPNGKDGHRDCRLKPMHGPIESYSDVILRLAAGARRSIPTSRVALRRIPVSQGPSSARSSP